MYPADKNSGLCYRQTNLLLDNNSPTSGAMLFNRQMSSDSAAREKGRAFEYSLKLGVYVLNEDKLNMKIGIPHWNNNLSRLV